MVAVTSVDASPAPVEHAASGEGAEATPPPRRHDDPGGRAWKEPVVFLCLAVIVLGALWSGILLAPNPPGEGSAEVGFARDMSVHHAQAVEMAELVRDRTVEPDIRLLASDISLTQQAQRGQMGAWLDLWGVNRTSGEPAMAWMGEPTTDGMPGMATNEELAAMRAARGAEADRLFLRAMIPHHRGGALMAEAVLDRTDQPEVGRLAEAMATSQRSEIEVMEDMLASRGDTSATPAVTMDMGGHGHSHGEGGFLAATSETATATVRLLPLAAAVLAAAWLAADAYQRRRGSDGADLAAGHAARRWMLAGAAGLALAGLLHLGHAPDHFDVSALHGRFFVGAALVELVLAAVVAATHRRSAAVTGAVVAGLLVVVYLATRVVAPPGAGAPEHIELLGLLTQGSQLVVVMAAMLAAAALRREPAAAPA